MRGVGLGHRFGSRLDREEDRGVAVLVVARRDKNAEALDLRVYPNPSSNGTLRIATSTQGDLHLFDASGRVVWQQAKVPAGSPVDVSGLTTRVYQLLVRSEKGVGSVRVVVE